MGGSFNFSSFLPVGHSKKWTPISGSDTASTTTVEMEATKLTSEESRAKANQELMQAVRARVEGQLTASMEVWVLLWVVCCVCLCKITLFRH